MAGERGPTLTLALTCRLAEAGRSLGVGSLSLRHDLSWGWVGSLSLRHDLALAGSQLHGRGLCHLAFPAQVSQASSIQNWDPNPDPNPNPNPSPSPNR